MHEKNNSVLEISFTSSKWDYIKGTREFIKEYLQLNQLKNEDISKVIVTASELLENALKYSSNGNVDIKLRKDIDTNAVIITIYNSATKADVEKVKQILVEMDAAANPLQYYIERMRDSTAKSVKGGGLGLARIRSETDASLTMQFDADKLQVNITAVLKF